MQFEDQEVWVPIRGYEGRYEVSSEGRVRSLNFKRTGRPGLLKASPNSIGYPEVRLRDGQSTYVVCVHRLVAQAFLPEDPGRPDVNHTDGNRMNNCVCNLEWCTRTENLEHARNTLGHQPDRAVQVTVNSTGEVHRFPTRAAAAKALDLDPRSLRKVLIGKLRQTRGCTATYEEQHANH